MLVWTDGDYSGIVLQGQTKVISRSSQGQMSCKLKKYHILYMLRLVINIPGSKGAVVVVTFPELSKVITEFFFLG